MKTRYVLFVATLLVLTPLSLFPQGVTGTPPFASFSGGPFDIVNNANLNVHFTIPILSKAGRGGQVNYGVTYDSSIWAPTEGYWVPATYTANWGWTSVGQALFGSNQVIQTTFTCFIISNGIRLTFNYSGYYIGPYTDSSNTQHPMNPTAIVTHTAQSNCGITAVTSGSATATDGSGYTVSVTNYNHVVVTGRNGISMSPGSMTDSNGNVLSMNTSGSTTTFTDTLGDTALTAVVVSPLKTTYSYSSAGGNVQFTFNYTQQTIQTNFGCAGIAEYPATPVYLLTSIGRPDGSQYSFTYEQTPGEATGVVTGRIASVTLPTGGTISYNWSTNSIVCADGTPGSLARTTPDGTWSYVHSEGGSTWKTLLTDPQGNTTTSNFAGLYETQRVYTLKSGGTPLTLTTCFNKNYASCATTWPTAQITQTDVYSTLANGSTRLSEVQYNTYGLVTDDKEYKYGVTQGAVPSSTYLVRETATSYASLGNGIVSRPASVTTSDWSSGKAVTLASSTYGYDQTTPATTSGTPSHVSISGSRGNLTTLTATTSGTASLSKTFTYYDTGNLNAATDVNGAQTTYVYGSGSCGNSFPTTINEPLSLSKSLIWNCTGGVITQVTDENNQPTAPSYSSDPFWRVTSMTDPLNNVTAYSYPSSTTFESATNFGTTSTSDVLVTTDGLGRQIFSQTRQAQGSTAFDSTQTVYGSTSGVGMLTTVSMPYVNTAGQPAPNGTPVTTTQYDGLGRPLTITDGGGGTVSYQYLNNDVLQSVGPTQTFQKQLEYDGLGRLTSVCEITTVSGSGSCGQSNPATGFLTKYTYDALGNLLTVAQNAQPGAIGGSQTRTFTYDGLSRMASESNPETSNTSQNGTTTYAYDSYPGMPNSAGDLIAMLKPNSDGQYFYYDALHRPTDVAWSGSDAYYCKRFRYDKVSNGTQSLPPGTSILNPLGRMVEADTDNCSSYTALTDEWFSYDADGRPTDVYESTPHSGGYYHATVGPNYWANGAVKTLGLLNSTGASLIPTLTYGVDGEGRPTSVTASSGQSPVTGVSYVTTNGTGEPVGALMGVTFGSLDSDTFNYDPSTGRMTYYGFNVNGQTAYGKPKWNANGTLQQLAITDPFNSADNQTCTYSYDDLARLGGTSCGSVWAQTFSYDPFGNVSKSGSISWLPNYASPINNQYQAGWQGLNGKVSYDANGNLLNDTFNAYTWDVYGKLASANGAAIAYDAFGRMVENHSGTYQFVYAPNGGKQPLAEMQGQSLLSAFLPLPGGAVANYNSSGLNQYMHADWLGSARLSSTPSRAAIPDLAYAPFGEGYAGGQQYEQFTGINAGTVFDTENQTGSLEDFMFRRYSPVQGRWISPDPAGLGAVDPSNPQSWNRYAYVMNSPLNWVDPLGLGPCGGRPCVYMPPDNYPGDEFDWLETSFWSDISGEDAFYVLAFPGAGGPCAFGLCGDINAAANNGNSICGNAKGKTIPVRAPFGQINFQFNDQGNLIGLGLQLTGANGLQDSGLGIPPNTFVGFSQLSPGTVQFGFSNPVQVGSGFSQAYFQTATFSGGSFTSVQGAYAPLGIPFGSSSGNSSLLQWALNGQVPFTSGLSSQAYNIGSTLTSLASLVSSNVSCKDVFGGG